MREQIVGVILDGISVHHTLPVSVDDLRLDIGGHFLGGNLTLEDIVDLVAGLYRSRGGNLDFLCIGFAVLRDSEVHLRGAALRDGVGQLHVEIHSDIAVE